MNDVKKNELNVYFQAQLVGTISTDDEAKINFEYENSWVENDNSFPISISLPLNAEQTNQESANNFFVNLLPEERIRARTCKKFGISDGNNFELLRRIGAECAGALTILPTEEKPKVDEYEYETITETRLVKWSQGDGNAFAEEAGENNVRLSLAGAQDKMPVMVRDSEFWLGKGSAPSTHILKFPSSRFSHLPENEVFTTMLADSVGLPVVKAGLRSVQLTPKTESRIAVIKRYDRYNEGANLLRLHQEDFCQALGFSPHRKYEEDGGPSLSDCAELIRENSSVPAIELEKFLRWVIFNWLCHNADGHAKNISFLFTEDGKTELAPFYDLVCTGNYTRQQIARALAMKIGGESSPGAIGIKNLERFSSDTEMPLRNVKENAIEIASRLLENLEQQTHEFELTFGNSPILQRIPRIAERRCERALKFLKK